MNVIKLSLTNVRQFEERSFPFKPGFNLLVGENGAGKTTLLRSLLAVLGSASQTGRRPALADEDIRLQTRELTVSADLAGANGELLPPSKYAKRWGKRAQRTRNSAEPLVLVYGSNEAICSSFVGQRIRKFSRSVQPETLGGEEWLHEAETRDVIAQGPNSGRRFGRSRVVRAFVIQVLSKFSTKFRNFVWRFEPYDCSIRPSERRASMRDLLKDTPRHLSNAIMRHLQEMQTPVVWPDHDKVEIDSRGYLVGVKEGRKQVIPEFRELLESSKLDSEAISHLESCTAEIRLTPRILVRSNDGNFFLSQLSDGEKRLFSLFVDIARQLSLESETVEFKSTPAIVLIDEIDVHLHPKWQRMVVPALEDLFPACQFIATTHSPFVIQAIAPGKLQRIDRVRDRPSSEDYSGKSIEDIIEAIQGIKMPQRSKRAEEMSEAAERYFKLVRLGSSAPPAQLREAEIAYRMASEPFTSEPGLNALLKLESIAVNGP